MTTASAAASADETAAPRIQRRHVAAAVVGNWLEFYDFVVYAYFAIQIGDTFFPGSNPFERLLLFADHLRRRLRCSGRSARWCSAFSPIASAAGPPCWSRSS